MRVAGCALGFLIVMSNAAIAQSDCTGSAKMVSERSSAAQKVEVALDKLRPGTQDHCKLANDFSQMTISLRQLIEQIQSRCSPGSIEGSAKTFFEFDVAALPSRLRSAQEHKQKCPR